MRLRLVAVLALLSSVLPTAAHAMDHCSVGYDAFTQQVEVEWSNAPEGFYTVFDRDHVGLGIGYSNGTTGVDFYIPVGRESKRYIITGPNPSTDVVATCETHG
jgi:hypothetical protein